MGKVGIALILSFAFVTGCGKSDPPPRPSSAVKDLANQDISAMGTEGSPGPHTWDQRSNNSFSMVFGSTSGSDVARYFKERIHYLIEQNEATVQVAPHPFTYTAWLTDATMALLGTAVSTARGEIEVGAANVGMELWLQALVNQVEVTVIIGPQAVPVTSGRVGIMVFGPGYRGTRVDPSGRVAIVPTEYRQAVLVHEARHSDCTGGVSDSDLSVAKWAANYKEFTTHFPQMTCGHLHVYCPSGDYAGLPACDITPWGAYSVSLIYAGAMIGNVPSQYQDYMKVVTADYLSRLLFDVDGMFAGKYGPADMTNGPYRRNN